MEKLIKKNAALLTGLMLVKKILSIIYKIPYQNQLGDAGFYVFQQVYPFVGLLMVLTSFAIPTVIGSLLVEHHYISPLKDKVKRALWIFALATFAILFLGNQRIALTMGDIQLAPIIRIAGVHFLFLPPIAYLRGVLQSRSETIGKMGYSVVIEQVIRVIAVLVVVFLADFDATPNHYYRIAELAFTASLISPVVTLIYLYWLQPVDDAQSFLPLTQKLQFTQRTLFLALSSGILIIFNMIDSFLVFNTLITNNQPQAASMLSTGVLERGLPLVQVGTFYVSSLVALSMSQFEKSETKKEKKLAFSAGMFFIMGLAVPGTVGLIQLMPSFNRLIFGNQLGTSTLQVFVVQVVLYAAIVLLTATLSKEEKQSYVQAAFLVGILVKLIITVPLVNQISIAGAAFSSVFSLTIMMLIMIYGTKHLITFRLIFTIGGIFAATFVMWIGISLSQPLLSPFYNGQRSGDFLIILTTAAIGITIYGLVMAIFIGIYKAFRRAFWSEQEKRQQEVKRIRKQQQYEQAQRQQEQQQQAAAEFERQRRIAALMQNKPKTAPTNVVNLADYQATRQQWEEPEQELELENYDENQRSEPQMRLDKFLKVSRIIKRRQTAKEVSDAGKIDVNDKVAKSSTSLQVGDEIALHYATRTLVVRVLALLDSTKKEDAQRMYEVISETPRET